MEFSTGDLSEMYVRLMGYVEEYIKSPRKEKLNALYEKYQERIVTAPASSIEHFHNAFPGGYIDHVLHVVENALMLHSVWANAGANIDNYTKEELVFSALNHDLGKIGDEEHEFYIPNPSDWHRRMQGKIYAINPEINNMELFDRGVYMLQTHGITVSKNEYIAMRCADGLYKKANEEYFISFEAEKQLKFNLPIILHHADMMALCVERDRWRKEQLNPESHIANINPQTAPKRMKSDPQKRNEALKETFQKSATDAGARFDEIFNSKKRSDV